MMDYLKNIFSFGNADISLTNEIKFYIHDEEHVVSTENLSAETTLNKYLRETLCLTGTKVMCQEGGCGCCIVIATTKHPVTNDEITFAVNSCLVSILSCHNWKISTVEGLGNSKTGYHKIQTALVNFNGTQCGFCSSGMVMNMYELFYKGKPTMKQVENSFGGNICRCTGYRPILAAFKSLCVDADPNIIGQHPDISDIEDLKTCKLKSECNKQCLPLQLNNEPLCFNLGDTKWFKVFTIDNIFTIFSQYPKAPYMLVSGNTAKGVYKINKPIAVYIDVSNVKELLSYEVKDDKLILGANMNLTDAIQLFYKIANENKSFEYLAKMADHIDLIANVPVRNIGSIAGNLSIKHDHHEFPSDMYLILATVGATLITVGVDKKEVAVTMVDYPTYNMDNKILKNVILPALSDHKYESYKIMPRAQNAHALVNAGFLTQLDNNNNVKFINIVYGCINPSFVHAKDTEKYLIGKNIFDNNTLQEAFKTLEHEINPDYILPDPTPDFRKQLAISLFYKFVLSIAPSDKISPQNKSGAQKQTRATSKGAQDYQTNKSLYPLTQPIPKIEAVAQVSGSAEYIIDMPNRPGQLFAAFVLAKSPPNTIIEKIDKTKALKLNGVVAYFDKNDIPGENLFLPTMYPVKEELFCSGVVKYYFQPVGIIVATSQEIAEEASELVEINYSSPKSDPLITIRDILKAQATDKIVKDREVKASSKGDEIEHVIKGSFDIGMQYHYHMETQCCNVIPVEDGLNIFPSSQGMDVIHAAIAANLKIQANKINIVIRRLGGAYGAKISRNGLVSCAAALAAHKLGKPVKMWMPFIVNMNVVGKRCPLSADYEAGVNNKGVIQYLTSEIYTDYGVGGNEPMISQIYSMYNNCYKNDTFNVTLYHTNTDTHAQTWCRAPGTVEGLGLIESIMDHISYSVGVDPLDLRLANLNTNKTEKLYNFIDDVKTWADIENRKSDIKKFNETNRWVKKGLAVVPMAYEFEVYGNWNIIISIYQVDGSVAIAHGGIEMGQGINTKAAQVCAYAFEIPLEKVSVKPSNNLFAPNNMPSGGSMTSEAVCFGILRTTEILKDRMRPIKDTMKNPTWAQLILKCYSSGINLTAGYMFNPSEVHSYKIYGVCSTEVEVDILTGNHQVTRVDLLEDTGESMSPEIDIGQVEGAFIMGLGFWTTEQIIYNKKGEILTNRTWTYKPPGAKDIPIDFRVKFPDNNPNPLGILRSKATGEPPMCLTCSIPLAIRNAVASARADSDPKADKWYPFDGPSTVENTFINSLHDYKQYIL